MTRWLLNAVPCALLVGWIAYISYDSSNIVSRLGVVSDAAGLGAIVLLFLIVQCRNGVIWPPAAPAGATEAPESYVRWGSECQAAATRATAIGLFLAVIGAVVAWSGLKVSLASFEVTTPERVGAEGTVDMVADDLRKSTLTVRVRAVGKGGKAKVTELGIYVEPKDRASVLLLDFRLDSPVMIEGDGTPVTIAGEKLNRQFGIKLHQQFGRDPLSIARVLIEPRYTDTLDRPRTPGGHRYALDPRWWK